MLTELIRDKKQNPENKVKITQNQIIDLTGISEAEVKRCIKRLKENHFIEIKEQGGLGRRYSVYTLNGRFIW